MTFFYDLNKRLADLATKQDAQHLAEHATPAVQQPKKGSLAQALNERDMGKHNNATTGFAALAKKTGGGEKGNRIAGAQLAKMRAKGQVEEMFANNDDERRDAINAANPPKTPSPVSSRDPGRIGGPATPVKHNTYDRKSVASNISGKDSAAYDYREQVEQGQLNELSPELLKRARDAAGEKWSAADDRKDKKASAKHNAQDDKFNSALRKKQKDMDESAVRIMAKPEGSQVTRGTAAYVPKNSIAGKTPQGQAHRDATAAMAKAARAASGKLAMNKTTDVTGKRVSGGYDAMAKGVTPYRSSTEESAFQAAIGKKKYGDEGMKALQKAGRDHASDKTMSNIRNRYDKYDESQLNELSPDTIASYQKKAYPQATTTGPKSDQRTAGIVRSLGRPTNEADMEEGNAFSKAVVDAKRDGIQKGEKIRVGDKELPLKELDMRLLKGAQGSMTGANSDSESERNKHKKYGYRSDRDDTGNDDDYDEHGNLKNKKKAAASDGPKKKGRPAKEKRPERVTAKSYKYKSGRPTKTKEDLDSDGVMMTRPSNMSSEGMDRAEYDDEAGMTKDSLHTIVRHARELENALRGNENMPEWVQEKIGQIKGMMSSVTDYIISTHEREAEQHMEPVAEKSVSQSQARMMAGAAHNPKFAKKVGVATKVAKEFNQADKGKDISKLPKKVKKTDEANDGNLANNAKPYDKVTQGDVVAGRLGKDEQGGKAKKAKEEKVDETTVSGSVATATPSGKPSKGMQFGKGVYESLNNSIEKMITESISIESKMQECGDGEMAPAITITADGEEAAKLMMLLKLAGLESQIPKACPTCGGSPCGCDQMVDENAPDWPTNTETLAADPNLRTYSGGLNGPKSTGQSTTPVLASQLRRQASMEESVALERNLFKTWQNYKG